MPGKQAFSKKSKVTCPKCGFGALAETRPVIHAGREPSLRQRVLDSSLFAWRCPTCGHPSTLLERCLYHDEQRGFMIYLLPGFAGRELGDAAVEAEFPELSAVKKRAVPEVNQLKEKILIFESGVDDLAVELAKLAVAGVVGRKYRKKVMSVYFCGLHPDQNQLELAFFLEGETQPVLYQTRGDVYQKSLEIVEEYAAEERESPCFLWIDAQWAAGVLERYRAQPGEDAARA